MKAKKKILKPNRATNIVKIKEWLVYSVLMAFSTFLIWLQISPMTYNDFDRICKNFNYGDCMRWYWQNLKFFQIATAIFGVFLIISVTVLLFFMFRLLRDKRKTR